MLEVIRGWSENSPGVALLPFREQNLSRTRLATALGSSGQESASELHVALGLLCGMRVLRVMMQLLFEGIS